MISKAMMLDVSFGAHRCPPPMPGASGLGGALILSCRRRYPQAIRGTGGFLVVVHARRQAVNALEFSDSIGYRFPPLLEAVSLPSWSAGTARHPWLARARLRPRTPTHHPVKKKSSLVGRLTAEVRALVFALCPVPVQQVVRAGAHGAFRAPPLRHSLRSLCSPSLRSPRRRGFRFRRFALGASLSRLCRRPPIGRPCARLLHPLRSLCSGAAHCVRLCVLLSLVAYPTFTAKKNGLKKDSSSTKVICKSG